MKRSVVFIGLLLSAVCASAQGSIQSATVDELADKLSPPESATRSMRNLNPQPRKIDLMIQFEFGSARLRETSKPLLLNLAEAMARENIKALRFKVEGHTDAVGKASYNQALSVKRAESVIDSLSNKGIEKDRLTAEGKGQTELLIPDRPEAMENRRVRIMTLN